MRCHLTVGTELWSSTRAASTLNQGAISPALSFYLELNLISQVSFPLSSAEHYLVTQTAHAHWPSTHPPPGLAQRHRPTAGSPGPWGCCFCYDTAGNAGAPGVGQPVGAQVVTVAPWPAPSGMLPLAPGELTWPLLVSTGLSSVWAGGKAHTRLLGGKLTGSLPGCSEATFLVCGRKGTLTM